MVASKYDYLYEQAAKDQGLPPELLKAQGFVESSYNPNARSPSGAEGIAQFMPPTAKAMGINPYDPTQAIPAQAKLIRENLNRYGNLNDAFLAYHGGTDKRNWGPKTQTYQQKVFNVAANMRSQQQDDGLDAIAAEVYKQPIAKQTTTTSKPPELRQQQQDDGLDEIAAEVYKQPVAQNNASVAAPSPQTQTTVSPKPQLEADKSDTWFDKAAKATTIPYDRKEHPWFSIVNDAVVSAAESGRNLLTDLDTLTTPDLPNDPSIAKRLKDNADFKASIDNRINQYTGGEPVTMADKVARGTGKHFEDIAKFAVGARAVGGVLGAGSKLMAATELPYLAKAGNAINGVSNFVKAAGNADAGLVGGTVGSEYAKQNGADLFGQTVAGLGGGVGASILSGIAQKAVRGIGSQLSNLYNGTKPTVGTTAAKKVTDIISANADQVPLAATTTKNIGVSPEQSLQNVTGVSAKDLPRNIAYVDNPNVANVRKTSPNAEAIAYTKSAPQAQKVQTAVETHFGVDPAEVAQYATKTQISKDASDLFTAVNNAGKEDVANFYKIAEANGANIKVEAAPQDIANFVASKTPSPLLRQEKKYLSQLINDIKQSYSDPLRPDSSFNLNSLEDLRQRLIEQAYAGNATIAKSRLKMMAKGLDDYTDNFLSDNKNEFFKKAREVHAARKDLEATMNGVFKEGADPLPVMNRILNGADNKKANDLMAVLHKLSSNSNEEIAQKATQNINNMRNIVLSDALLSTRDAPKSVGKYLEANGQLKDNYAKLFQEADGTLSEQGQRLRDAANTFKNYVYPYVRTKPLGSSLTNAEAFDLAGLALRAVNYKSNPLSFVMEAPSLAKKLMTNRAKVKYLTGKGDPTEFIDNTPNTLAKSLRNATLPAITSTIGGN